MASPVKRARRDFGSFHASNVLELVSIPDDEYVAPKIPIPLPSFDEISSEGESDAKNENGADGTNGVNGHTSFQFGKKARDDYFLLEPECCFLNHGAFGSVLKPALEAAQDWQRYAERQPLRFFDRELLPLLAHVTRRMAKFVDCDPRDLVLVNNATYGINSVLNSLNLGANDVIMSFNITYGATKKLLQHVCMKTGARLRDISLPVPIESSEEIVNALDNVVMGNVTLVIIDHIPSNSPFIMPLKEMIEVCRERNIKVFVDGAHALGTLSLSLRELDPDFYVSNAHKWLCSPKGAAFLYVKRHLHNEVRPAVISHGYGSGFTSEFVWAGLHDYSPMLALMTVLDFWEAVGEKRIRIYQHDMIVKAAQLLTAEWNTGIGAPLDMSASMSLVELPDPMQTASQPTDYAAAEKIQNCLYHNFNIEVPIKCVQGTLYARISAHIYNQSSDYLTLAKAIYSIHTENMLNNENGQH